jgi:hypothetical protein
MAIIFCDAGLPDKFNGFQFAKLCGNWASGQFYKQTQVLLFFTFVSVKRLASH